MVKTFIDCNCVTLCPYSNTCCKVPTEVIRHEGRQGIDILIFGMGAGKDEEKQKRCFVGRSGKYMRQIIKHIWDTRKVFNLAISNNVRFHPMDANGKDREPTREEIDRCLPLLIEDIRLLNPLAIVPVGKNATCTFHDFSNQTMTMLRGKSYDIEIPSQEVIINVVPTWHPSFLTRQYGTFKPEENNKFDKEFISDIHKALDLIE